MPENDLAAQVRELAHWKRVMEPRLARLEATLRRILGEPPSKVTHNGLAHWLADGHGFRYNTVKRWRFPVIQGQGDYTAKAAVLVWFQLVFLPELAATGKLGAVHAIRECPDERCPCHVLLHVSTQGQVAEQQQDEQPHVTEQVPDQGELDEQGRMVPTDP